MVVLATLVMAAAGGGGAPIEEVACDVVVVGGSVAGLAAAVTAAKEGARTCLLSPTDWLGGQMSANGIPALDFSTENGRTPFNTTGAPPDTLSVNQPRDFVALLHSLNGPNYRDTCWVSPYCFLPTELESGAIVAMVAAAGPNLRVFRETVLVNATTARGTADQPIRITAATAVRRIATATARCGGYGDRLSQSLPDWYSTDASPVFEKQLLQFTSPVWVDTSYNGELLVLAGAPYLQGIDESFDGDTRGTAGNDTIGQSFTMTYHSHLHGEAVPQPDDFPPMDSGWAPDPFAASPAVHTPSNRLSWPSLWTRRRSFHSFAPPRSYPPGSQPSVGMDPPPVNNVSVGDVHLAAWPDFHFGYLWTSKRTTAATVGTSRWVGGYNMHSLDGAERYSYGAYRAYARLAPPEWQNHTDLNSTFLGTCTGLSKLPYVRDGRRSIGVDNFVIDINFTKTVTSTHLPPDCVALMGHGFDIWGHRMMNVPMNNTGNRTAQCAPNDAVCNAYPEYMRGGGSTGQTCAPLRGFTNAKAANLIVGGYTMAQSFMINSALRMHPEEFAGGVAAGAAAAHMADAKIESTAAALRPAVVAAIQTRIVKHAPLQYGGKAFPGAVGYTCAAPLERCVQVPGGGSFSRNNTAATCPSTPECSRLGADEWLALVESYRYDAATQRATFTGATRIKKSTVNSGNIPANMSLAVPAGTSVQLTTAPTKAFKVDRYAYVLVVCAAADCGLTHKTTP